MERKIRIGRISNLPLAIFLIWALSTCGGRSELDDGCNNVAIEALSVMKVMRPSPPGCASPASEDAEVFVGVLDRKYANGYSALLRLRSTPSKREGLRFEVKSAEVNVTDAEGVPVKMSDGSPVVLHPSVTGVLGPAPAGDAGVADVSVNLLDDDMVTAIWSSTPKDAGSNGITVLASIVLRATTNDDLDVETDPFVFPIQVCSGCLCKADTCNDMGSPPEPVCRIGQDDEFDCRLREDGCD